MSTDKTLADALTRFRCAGYDPTDGSGPIMVADPDGPWVLASDVIGTSSDCEATPASPDSPESGGDWFGDVLGSIGTVIPLADVQPGGMVRLGDGLRSELLDQAERLERMAAQDRETGESIEQALEAGEEYTPDDAPDIAAGLQHDANRSEEIAALLRKAAAALSAQPSPGGQGEARDQFEAWAKDRGHDLSVTRDHPILIDGVYEDGATSSVWAAWQAALAARQPVGDQHPDDLAVDAFAAAMKAKMAEARAKGRGGWEDPAQCSADDLTRMLRDHVEKGDPLDVANFCMMLHQRREAIAARQPVGEPEEHACSNCDRKHVEAICPTCAGIAWDNGRLHEFHEVRELSTSLGEGVLDHLLPDEWHEKPLLRFQGAYDEGDDSVGISPRSANVLAEDQNGTVLGDYLAARAAKEGSQ